MPYPPCKASAPCERYANIISNLYAGHGSELYATMRYTYDSLAFATDCKEAHEVLESIAICEMHHLEKLGKLLISLGAKPKFHGCENGKPLWFSTSPAMLPYPNCLGMALLDNIADEKKAIEAYGNAIRCIDDDAVDMLLRRIIMDEEHHIKLLAGLYERCCK